MENPLLVFISSIMNPQKDDLLKERDAAKEAINSILPTLSWRFEDSPASSERVDHFYFNKVKECDIFLIILGQEITEPVESEYGTAKDSDKPKLTFLKKGVMRSQALQDFIKKIDVKYAEFETSDDLRERIREAVRDELIQGYKKFRISREEKSWLETFKALPDVKVFFGREKEIEDLYRMIHERRSKVIAITGQGGTGKSALAAKLLEELAKRNESFEAISWQSLRYKPTFDLIIDDLIITLSKEITQEDIGRAETEKKINLLIRLLNQKCCLVVLDNLETIFKSGDEANVGKCEDPNYGTLLKALTESAHESQVIITSRETPTEASKKLQDFQPYPPNGITGIDYQSAVKLIRSQSLDGTEEEFKILAEKYRGHPLALILVAGMIREDYNGKVERFKMQSLVVEGIDELIEEQFKRLSEPERRLLYRISVFREVVPFEALMALGEGSSEKEIKEIRELARKLRRRSLLNYEFLNEVETYDLHPLVEEYAYERLEDKIKAHRLVVHRNDFDDLSF